VFHSLKKVWYATEGAVRPWKDTKRVQVRCGSPDGSMKSVAPAPPPSGGGHDSWTTELLFLCHRWRQARCKIAGWATPAKKKMGTEGDGCWPRPATKNEGPYAEPQAFDGPVCTRPSLGLNTFGPPSGSFSSFPLFIVPNKTSGCLLAAWFLVLSVYYYYCLWLCLDSDFGHPNCYSAY
jgi:hypothetical protein